MKSSGGFLPPPPSRLAIAIGCDALSNALDAMGTGSDREKLRVLSSDVLNEVVALDRPTPAPLDERCRLPTRLPALVPRLPPPAFPPLSIGVLPMVTQVVRTRRIADAC